MPTDRVIHAWWWMAWGTGMLAVCVGFWRGQWGTSLAILAVLCLQYCVARGRWAP